MASINKDEINELVKQENYSKAEELIRQYLHEEPKDMNALTFLGKLLCWQDKDEEAIKILLEAENLDTDNFRDNFTLGLAYEFTQKFDEAIDRYFKAIAKDEGTTYINFRIGHILNNYKYTNRDEKKAKYYLQAAIESENPVEEAFYELAGIEGGSRAVYILKNGVKKFPKSISFYERIANFSFYHLDNAEGCIQALSDALAQEISSDELFFTATLAYKEINNYEKALETLSRMSNGDSVKEIQLFKAVLLLENNMGEDAQNILQTLISEDYQNSLYYSSHFVLISIYLRKGLIKKAEDLLNEIPIEYKFDRPQLGIYYYGGEIDVSNYYLEALDQIIIKSENRPIILKAKAGRAKFYYNFWVSDDNQLYKENPKAVWVKIKDDATDAEKLYDRDAFLKKILGNSYLYARNWLKASHYLISAQLLSEENEYLKLPFEEIYQNKERNQKFLRSLNNYFDHWDNEKKFCLYFLGDIIKFLYEKKEFQAITDIANKVSNKNLSLSSVLFQIAYSFVEIKDEANGKKYYQMILEKSEDFATLNNIGLIYERENKLEEARNYFKKSAEHGNQKAMNNLERVEEKIKIIEGEKIAFEKAKLLFGQEVEEAKKLAITLYEKRDIDGLIICNLKNITDSAGIYQSKVKTYLDDFLKKKYFLEVKNTSFPFDGIVIQINQSLVPIIEDEIKSRAEKEVIVNLTEGLSSQNLDQRYGYNNVLLSKLNVLSSPDLALMLQRDIKELIFSLVAGSYKSVLVLSGSILEAILLDRLSVDKPKALLSLDNILKREGKSITSKDKDLETWGLERLLDVAYEGKIISQNLYYWCNGLRGYRNLVHPGVEKRKQLKISKGNAEIGWNVVKNLIDEI